MTGNTTGITVNQTSAVTGLYPGGPAAPLSGNFDNPNAGAVHVGTVTVSIASSDNGAATANPTSLTFTPDRYARSRLDPIA